jgi:hypothetical protein
MPIARAAEITEQQAYDIGPEAYTYLYPLGTMDLTRKHATNIEADKMPGRGPMNTFSYPVLPSADWKEVFRRTLTFAIPLAASKPPATKPTYKGELISL